jgi:sigma-54 dependent transcriptional regulator, acetoin dehydrogenase operon transcriptional activator AcoR
MSAESPFHRSEDPAAPHFRRQAPRRRLKASTLEASRFLGQEARLQPATDRREVEAPASAGLESERPRSMALAYPRLDLLLDHLPHGVMAHAADGRIFYFNAAAERISGFDRSEVLGRSCRVVFGEHQLCDGQCRLCRAAGSGEPGEARAAHAVRFLSRGGQSEAVEVTSVPMSDTRGRHVGTLVTLVEKAPPVRVAETLEDRDPELHGILARDPQMLEILRKIRTVAASDVTVVLEGESGTGKELIARAIHLESPRARQPFVAINCGAVPESLLESEFFGHVKGAFTGASRDRNGCFVRAHGGTLLLDEVTELSPCAQVDLLRVLETGQLVPVGGEWPVAVDVRVIAASNKNLRKMVEQGAFRADLYYRLSIVPLTLPPLRARRLDIPMLTRYFLHQRVAARPGAGASPEPSEAFLAALLAWPWPGNVRELKNVLEYACLHCDDGTLEVEHLPAHWQATRPMERAPASANGSRQRLSAEHLAVALAQTGGHRSKAAKLLGIGRTTFYHYLKLFGLG